MNRREFSKTAGMAAVAATIAPKFLAETTSPIINKRGWASIGCFGSAEKGYDYVIGVVPKTWTDQSVISVWRKGKDDEPLVQVAEITGSESSILTSARIVGKEFGKYLSGGALFAIDQAMASGDTIQHQLKLAGFRRFHKMEARQDEGKSKDGWYTTDWSFSIMIDRFLFAHQEKQLVVRSDFLRRDLTGAAIVDFSGKKVLSLPNAKGNNRFLAAAIAYNSSVVMWRGN